MKKLRASCKITHQTVVKLPPMYRVPSFLILISLAFLLTACPGDVDPPCTGDECAQLCENAVTADFRSIPPEGTKNPVFEGETSFLNCYARGTSNRATFTIRPATNADLNAPRAAVVFAIVDREDSFEPVTQNVIDINNYNVEPDIFSNPLPMSDVSDSDGLSATVDFKINGDAPRGELKYSLVISAFRLQDGQDPDDVTNDPNALIGRAAFWFSVE